MITEIKILLVFSLVLFLKQPLLFSADLYVSPSGSGTAPYDTWAKAATSVRTAVQAANDGDTVIITNGNYAETAETIISKAITVKSVNGPTATTVRRTGASTFRVFTVSNSTAQLIGLTVTNGDLSALQAPGAGIRIYSGIISNCIIEKNASNRGVGGLLMYGGLCTHSIIRYNRDDGNYLTVGGIHISNGMVSNCQIYANTAMHASGVKMSGSGSQAPILTGCIISNNYRNAGINLLDGNERAIEVGNSKAVIENCLIINNSGRGIYMTAGQVRHCTISGNSTFANVGNGIYMTGGYVTNSIVYFNNYWSYVFHGSDIYKSGGTVSYSCSFPLISGTGNISGDPRFVNRYGSDFRLQPSSPCIDSGITLAGVPRDYSGTSRPIDGDGVGGAQYDMGAYETGVYNGGIFRCGYRASAHEGTNSLEVVFTAYAAGADRTITWYGWDFNNDGTYDIKGSSHGVVTNTFGVGMHTIKLRVTNSSLEAASITVSNDIRVLPLVSYVKPTGSPVYPYDSWVKAATNISTALFSGAPVIKVTNGTYRSRYTIRVGRPVVIEGTNAQNTVVARDSAGGTFSVFYLNNASAILDGLTVSNGYNSGAGGGIWQDNGIVRNCIIRNNEGNRYPGGILLVNGLVVNSVIRNNIDSGNYLDHAGGVDMSGGVISNCVFYSNRGGSHQDACGALRQNGGYVYNCIFTNNIYGTGANGGKAGGIILNGGEIRNCLVANNNGRGIYMTGGRATHVTVAGNSGKASYGNGMGQGIYITAGYITNSIIYHNGSGVYLSDNSNASNAGGVVVYSCAPELTGGTGNITDDPRFTYMPSRNYTLSPASPCIDKGTAIPAIITDLAGNSRPTDGDGVGGSGYDMGCYETQVYNSGALRCGFRSSLNEGTGPQQVVFTSYVAGANTTITWYGWDFDNDGTWEITGSSKGIVTNTFGIGIHTVKLRVTNAVGESAQAIQVNDIRIKSDTAYVWTGGSHTLPYDTWAKAATNLASAINSGALIIYVTNGTHKVTGEIDVGRKLTIRSVNGPAFTTIARTGSSSFNIFYVHHSEALLWGLTVSNGYRGRNTCGGIVMTDGKVDNCIIRNNSGNRAPGGMYLTGGVVTNCIIRDNYDSGDYLDHAGGVEISGSAVIRNCIFYGNRGGTHLEACGALLMNGGYVYNCIFTNNTYGTDPSGGKAGGIILNSGVLENCLVANNNGRGIYMTGGRATHVTVAGNSGKASYGGGTGKGIYMSGGSITNSIIYHNDSYLFLKDNSNLARTGGTVSYSCAPELSNGVGNITNDPRIARISKGDLTIRPGSPCIDSGISMPAITTDLGGNSRPKDGDGVGGSGYDIGCYEAETYNSGSLRCGFTCSRHEGVGNVSVIFISHVAGANTTISWYGWDFDNDGTWEITGSSRGIVTNIFSVGTYTVKLRVTNAIGESAEAIQDNDIRIGTDTAYVKVNGAHISPYDTWAKAATNLEAALATGAVNIFLSNGTHKVASEVVLTRQVTITGINGASATVVARGGSGNYNVFYLNHPQAILDGLTVSNGWNGRNNAGGMVLANGLVKNCIIKKNQGQRGPGALYITGGVVSNCTIISNTDPDNSATCGGITMTGGLITHSRIEKNKGGSDSTAIGGIKISGGVVQFSVIASNEAGTTANAFAAGGRLSGGLIRNCVIYGNQSGTNGSTGGIYIEGGIIESCTIVGNKGGTGAGGINAMGGAITNCIIWANAKYGTTNDVAGTPSLCKYSCAPELSGVNNINSNPIFEANGTNYGILHVKGDYRLRPNSPCINKGILKNWMRFEYDVAGEKRYRGQFPEIGAYEYIPPKGSIIVVR